MSEIDQGLEVVTDENGQQLVKLVIVDENNEATGFAYVTPEEATQILSGNATLQTNTDETTGETVASVQPNPGAVGGEEANVAGSDASANGRGLVDSGGAAANINSGGDVEAEAAAAAAVAAGIDAASMDTLSKVINNTDSLQTSTAVVAAGLDPSLVLQSSGDLSINEQVGVPSGGLVAAAPAGEEQETVTLVEKTEGEDASIVANSGETMILMDPMGNVIKSEDGQPVLLEIEGQHYEYNPQTGMLTMVEEGVVGGASVGTVVTDEQGKMIDGDGVEVTDGSAAAGGTVISADERGPEFWRPVRILNEHVEALRDTAEMFMPSIRPDQFQPEPYHKKLGSQMAYREMIGLMNFDRHTDPPARLELLRKHAMLFRQAGPHSRPLNVQEQAVNEAAAQVCRILPTLLFHRRELSTYAKQVIQMSGIDFTYHSQSVNAGPATQQVQPSQQHQHIQQHQPQQASNNIAQSGTSQKSAAAIPSNFGSANSGIPGLRKDYTSMLSADERTALRTSVMQLQGDLPRYRLKAKDECSVIERYCHEDAVKIMKQPMEKLDDHMDFLRDASAIYGRYPSGPRNMAATLTPFEVACNESAAWLVRLQPALLTYRRELTDLAKKAVRQCGLYFRHTPYSNVGPGGRNAAAADVLYRVGGAGAEFITEPDLSAAESVLHGHLVMPSPAHAFTSSTGMTLMGPPDAMVEEEDLSLEDTGDGDSLTAMDMENGETMRMECEAVDNVLTEAAILQISGTDDLKRIRSLTVSGCGLTNLCPIDLARCVNMRELDLSNNSLNGLPRCLYLPRLRRLDLRNNPGIKQPPLLEQFGRLRYLYLDDALVGRLNRQMLAYFCPKLTTINGQAFKETVTEATRKAVHDARFSIEPHVMARWEMEYAPFYKKGITPIDRIKLLESFVLHMYDKLLPFQEDSALQSQLNGIGCELSAYKDLITRTFADDFLRPRLVVSIDPDSGDLEDGEIATTDWAATLGEDLSDEESEGEDGMEDKEVQTALCPEEPLEKACVIIGQSMRAGRCIFYSVVRPQGLTGRVIAGTSGPTAAAAEMQAALSKTTPSLSTKRFSPPRDRSDLRLDETLRPEGRNVDEDAEGNVIDIPRTPSPDPVADVVASLSKIATINKKGAPVKPPTQRRAGRTPGSRNIKAQAKQQQPMPAQNATTSGMPASKVVTPTLPPSTSALSRPAEAGAVLAPAAPAAAASATVTPAVASSAAPIPLPAAAPASAPAGSIESTQASTGRYMSTRDSNKMKRFTADGVVNLSNLKKPAKTEHDEYEFVPSPPSATTATAATPNKKRPHAASPMKHASPAAKRGRVLNKNLPISSISLPAAAPPLPGSAMALVAQTGKNLPPPKPLPLPAASRWGSMADLGRVTDFDPLHFIRCHARDNNPMDSETKVWRCSFEPRPDALKDTHSNLAVSDTTHVVATCGGECVCLIDCRTGKVLKRFKHLQEEFYTVAWTTVTLEDGTQTNLMAAGGKMAEIRLLHPDQLVCYAEMKGHHDEIACMTFHSRSRPTILFSGDASAAVLVWDIGVPRLPDYRTRYHLLMRLRCPRANLNPVLNLVYLPNWSSLIAGCEDGIFAWWFNETQFSPESEYKKEREPDLELRLQTKHEPCFDGLSYLHSGIVLTKCVEDGELVAFDYGATFDSMFSGKKANAGGGMKSIAVPLRGALVWHPTEEIYINMSARASLSTVLCGDNEGSVWLYDIKSQIVSMKKTGAPTNKKFRVKPLKILEWPECSVSGNRQEDRQLKDSISAGFKNPVVNTCDLSSDGRYLVAVTDNNLVCIWSYSGGDEVEEEEEEEENNEKK